jgi:cell division protein FtsQ
MILIIGSVGFSSWWIWHSDFLSQTVKRAKASFILSTAEKGFVVSKVLVNGRIETSRKDLLRALNLKSRSPILTFNTKLARIRVKALPWVQEAIIKRQLPDVIYLSILERRPFALWQRNGVFSLIDETGDLIPLDDVSAFANLIILVGKDAPTKAKSLFEVLARQPQLAKRVTAAVRVGGRRWNLHLNSQVEVLLPEKGADAAWKHLATLYKKYRQLFNQLETIDLRLTDRVVIKQGNNGIVGGVLKELPEIQYKRKDKSHNKFKRQLRSDIGVFLATGKET